MSDTRKRRPYRVVVTTRFGGVRQLYRVGDGYSYRRGKKGRAFMSALEVDGAKRWAKRRLAKGVRMVGPDRQPFIVYPEGVHPPTNKNLLRAVNATGRKRRRLIRCVSGMRTPRQAWELRMLFLDGRGATAALCCTKYSGTHSWADCGKNPQSNHADGNAMDCGTIDKHGTYRSLGLDQKAKRIFLKLGGCFPVMSPQPEWWHCEFRG